MSPALESCPGPGDSPRFGWHILLQIICTKIPTLVISFESGVLGRMSGRVGGSRGRAWTMCQMSPQCFKALMELAARLENTLHFRSSEAPLR